LKFNKEAWLIFCLLVFVFGYFYQNPGWNRKRFKTFGFEKRLAKFMRIDKIMQHLKFFRHHFHPVWVKMMTKLCRCGISVHIISDSLAFANSF